MTFRTRYAMLALAMTLALIIVMVPNSRRHGLSLSAASIVHWTSQAHDIVLPPIQKDGSPPTKPPPPPAPFSKDAKAESRKGEGGDETETPSSPGAEAKGEDRSGLKAFDQTDPLEREYSSWKGPDHKPRPKPQRKAERERGPPVPDPFPLLTHPPRGYQLARLLAPPPVNAPPRYHYPEETPLLIGFTRNWPQLLQCVASYIAAGWPPEDIYVVENTGVMAANRDGKLSLQNPFYLNHTQLALLGVTVLTTPTLLSFAQLQNFYTHVALERDWADYFWSHQDVLVFSHENETIPADPNKADSPRGHYSLYTRAVAILQYLRQEGIPKWASHFFAYDHLTLVHRDAYLEVGGWDTHIPYYGTDCDMYDRLMWAGYWQGETPVGIVLDVSTVLEDLGALFRLPGVEARFAGDPGPFANFTDEKERKQREGDPAFQESEATRRRAIAEDGESFTHLVEVGRRMEQTKYADGGGWRNVWQLRQDGGQGEPFYRDPEGFEIGLRMLIETGRRVFAEKWGHRGCDIAQMGILAEDAWRLERDWDPATEGSGSEGADW